MGDFELDTRVEAIDDNCFSTLLSPDWAIWGPNGGYLVAIAMRACGERARIARPVSLSCHFLRRGEFGEATVRVEVLQQGRRSESFSFRIEQRGRLLVTGLLRTAAEGPALEHDVTSAPTAAGTPDTLPSFEDVFPGEKPHFPFWENFDRRFPYGRSRGHPMHSSGCAGDPRPASKTCPSSTPLGPQS